MQLEWFQILLITTALLELNPLLQTFKIIKTKFNDIQLTVTPHIYYGMLILIIILQLFSWLIENVSTEMCTVTT